MNLICNERVCIQYVECLQQLPFINMFISLATKTYRGVHFVDSEARVKVGERRYGGTNLIKKKNRLNETENVSGKIHTQEVVRAVSAAITLALLL